MFPIITQISVPNVRRGPGTRRLRAGAAAIFSALIFGAGVSLAASAQTAQRPPLALTTDKDIGVSVNFSVQLPLGDLSEAAIARNQETGRRLFYAMAISECKVLLDTIAATCELSNLSVSTHLNDRANRMSAHINLSGHANYRVTLKEETPGKTETPAQ